MATEQKILEALQKHKLLESSVLKTIIQPEPSINWVGVKKSRIIFNAPKNQYPLIRLVRQGKIGCKVQDSKYYYFLADKTQKPSQEIIYGGVSEITEVSLEYYARKIFPDTDPKELVFSKYAKDYFIEQGNKWKRTQEPRNTQRPRDIQLPSYYYRNKTHRLERSQQYYLANKERIALRLKEKFKREMQDLQQWKADFFSKVLAEHGGFNNATDG